MNLITLLAGILAGTAIAMQSTFSATLSRAIGLWPTTFVVHLVGTLVALLPLFLFRTSSNWAGWSTAPWYVYSAGLIGVIIIYSVSYVISHASVAAGVSVVIASQLAFALLIDQFGWFGVPAQPIDWLKLLGVVLLFVGARLVIR